MITHLRSARASPHLHEVLVALRRLPLAVVCHHLRQQLHVVVHLLDGVHPLGDLLHAFLVLGGGSRSLPVSASPPGALSQHRCPKNCLHSRGKPQTMPAADRAGDATNLVLQQGLCHRNHLGPLLQAVTEGTSHTRPLWHCCCRILAAALHLCLRTETRCPRDSLPSSSPASPPEPSP